MGDCSRVTDRKEWRVSEVHPRVEREARTVEAMIRLYCRQRHASSWALCADCAELLAYARARLNKCPFQGSKPTCARCPVHCYQPEMRERVRAVMRYAGPRMLVHHPLLALLHLIDGWTIRPPKRR
jgi:hypothetical protein